MLFPHIRFPASKVLQKCLNQRFERIKRFRRKAETSRRAITNMWVTAACSLRVIAACLNNWFVHAAASPWSRKFSAAWGHSKSRPRRFGWLFTGSNTFGKITLSQKFAVVAHPLRLQLWGVSEHGRNETGATCQPKRTVGAKYMEDRQIYMCMRVCVCVCGSGHGGDTLHKMTCFQWLLFAETGVVETRRNRTFYINTTQHHRLQYDNAFERVNCACATMRCNTPRHITLQYNTTLRGTTHRKTTQFDAMHYNTTTHITIHAV